MPYSSQPVSTAVLYVTNNCLLFYHLAKCDVLSNIQRRFELDKKQNKYSTVCLRRDMDNGEYFRKSSACTREERKSFE